MSDKKAFAIKEIEFRINKCKEICDNGSFGGDPFTSIDEIDTLLFDIQDFINDLKELNETN